MPTLPPGGDLAELLNLQTHLLNLLRHDAPAATADQPATAAQYAMDLRVISCLAVASWPAARHLALTAAHAELVDDHVHDVRAPARGQIHMVAGLFEVLEADPLVGHGATVMVGRRPARVRGRRK